MNKLNLNNFDEFMASFTKMKLIKSITSDELDKMKKIRLVKNNKYQIKGQSWKTSTSQFKQINMNQYNAGIPTGEINNLIVIDIDLKKELQKEQDGFEKIQEFIK